VTLIIVALLESKGASTVAEAASHENKKTRRVEVGIT
jgi:hypothetical protein